MYYMLERIQKICNELKEQFYTKKISISEFLMLEGNYKNIEEVQKINDGWKSFSTGDLWGGRDCHAWLKTKVTVPKDFEGKVIALSFKTFDEGWDAINPQFILYINGEHIQGLDINHREVIISDKSIAGETYEIDLHTYSGMLSNRKFTVYGDLVVIDKSIRELFYNLQVPIWVCEKLKSEDKRRIDMLEILNEAINLLDLRKPFTSKYYESISLSNEYLENEFYKKLCGKEEAIATCVGHTHIDVAWHWTVAQTREKVGRSFSTVLKLMEEYPEYIFMSSQPQLYKFIKEDYPSVYEKIKEKIKKGVWEPEGAMWLEADCNVTSGESLVRQILFGKRFFKNEFGVENEILWLPDVFGYSAALPQILKKSDVNYFMTTKISWNQFNKMPYDTFMWKGIDGTEILTHFITTKGAYQEEGSHFTTYNGEIHPGAIIGAWDRYQQKNINNDVLVSFGFGDGGGGATYEMLEVGRRLNRGIPGCPKVEMGTSKDYFKRLESKVKGHKRLPKWSGELYLEYHRGTYTSMARNKKANRVCENLYQTAEKINSFSMLLGKDYPQEKLNTGWEKILLNQFHDILPGSSIKEVYEVTKEDYKELIANGDESLKKGIDFITSKINLEEDALVVFNPLSFDRSDVCYIDLPSQNVNYVIYDELGNETKCQRVEGDKGIFFAKDIPACGYRTFRIKETVTESFEPIHFNKEEGENQFFKVKFDDYGQIKSIYYKGTDREILKKGQLGNVLQAFEDKPMNFDNWDIDIFYSEKMWPIDDVESIEIIEKGPVRAALMISRRFQDSKIIQKIYIYKDLPRIDFDTYVDWKESQVLLKTAFPIDINSDKATFEIQYGNIERTTNNNTSWDTAQFEVCGQRWVDISESGFGVSLLNDCKYGHDIKDNNMRLTLIKSGIEPNPTTDQEEHSFLYSIYPHCGEWREGNTIEQASNINIPLYSKFEKSHAGELPDKLSMVKVNRENVNIEVIKKAEDSDELIIRVNECYNKRVNATLEIFRDIVSAYECNLLEKNIEEMNFNGNQINFEIKPFEIKTFKVKVKQS